MLATLLLAALPLAAPASLDTLTLEDCVALARRNAPAVRVAGQSQRAALGDSAATALNRRPEYSLRAGATLAPKGYYDPVVTNLGDYELKAGADWTLADGGARSRERSRSVLALSSARGQAALAARDAGLQAAELALRLQRLAEAEAGQRQSLEWLASLASLVRGGVAAGVRGPADSIRVALERDAVEADLEGTWLEVRSASLSLRALLGRDGDGVLAIAPEPEATAREPEVADSLALLAASARRPELALARLAEQERRLDLDEARRAGSPTFDVSLDAGLAGADLTHTVPEALRASDPNATLSDRLRQDLGASLALHARLPVLDGARAHRTEARAADLEAAALERRAAELDEQRRAALLIDGWRSASRRLQAAQVTLERAERNVLRVKSLFGAGAASLLDLLDARRVFEEARDRRADARSADRWARFQVEDGR